MRYAISLKACLIVAVMLCTLMSSGVAQMGCQMNKQDATSSVMTNFTGLRNSTFCELILWCNNTGGVYGTQGLNNQANPKDTCPKNIYAGVNLTAIQKQYQVKLADINPPVGRKYWILDKMELPVSPKVHDFSGLQAHWYSEMVGFTQMPPYVPASIARDSIWTFEKGQPVFLLEDTNGTTWIMKNYVTTEKHVQTYEGLSNLLSQLKLPPGWKYRTAVLNQTLTIVPVKGMARIMWDEWQDAYDACDPGVCSIKP